MMPNKSARLRGLYGITDEHLLAHSHALLSAVEDALRGGLSILQYRAKSLATAEQTRQAMALRRLCSEHDALFIINDDVELAKAVAADGVHVGRDDAAIASARDVLGAEAIIGVSCYNRLDLALQAQQHGADYVAFGRFFASQTKPRAVPAQPELLSRAKAGLDLPLCAIGGITTDNGTSLIEQGADMLAVIHDLFSATSVEAQAKKFSTLFNQNIS
jgi:thiamine-phosphate pyrophosphorylase